MKKLLIIALAAAPLLASASPALGPNLVTNGGFEIVKAATATQAATSQKNHSYSVYSSIYGWKASHGIELRNDFVGTGHKSPTFAELDVNVNSAISQVITTDIGQWYQLSFDYANRAGATNGLGWSFGETAGAAIIAAPKLDKAGWTTFTTQVRATSNHMTLSLAALGKSDGVGSSLDNVQLNAVPEPTSLALMGLGLAAMGLVSRRKKQKRG
ncbi:PEP-CTERM sorting domain-containing protein [Roseateles oligotrophus]|uniref:DUF642 domain-containing protein n=1 Tax=Roseateles oligotrophus TaxID=1769250 RepID=A0ABT2YAM9_9BURK|nr:PEP-CTERM sorting domain-containing protein [Roseateles oligotrophus]MCV2366617.1 DUF642 domain-containing protein [Roseateles oligotrophus]